jgi:hypothetical protein
MWKSGMQGRKRHPHAVDALQYAGLAAQGGMVDVIA